MEELQPAQIDFAGTPRIMINETCKVCPEFVCCQVIWASLEKAGYASEGQGVTVDGFLAKAMQFHGLNRFGIQPIEPFLFG